MKSISIWVICALFFTSCSQSPCDKAVSHLDKWFNNFDSSSLISANSKKYYKSIDFSAKEIAVESVIDQEIGTHPSKENIEFRNPSGSTQSYYEWDCTNCILKLDVYYTDPLKTPGLRYELTVQKK